ncbi:MAG: tripartite tricarboxylate transporter TctB family protein [Pseudomonadales bacterium]|nr:tripartite tricarboxylate transporter TctB family protein [Pseudomonadales bacterium]
MTSQPKSTKRTQIPGELVFACLLLSLSLLIAFYALSISGFSSMSSPGSIPMLAALFMLVSSLITVIKTTGTTTKNSTFITRLTPPILLFFASISLTYILVIDQLGFLISSGLFLFASILALYRQGPSIAMLVSINTLAIIYIIFRLIFKVILPEANLWE